MEKGDIAALPLKHSERKLSEQAISSAVILIAESLNIAPDQVTDSDVVEAYRKSGFADWEPELADRVRRALGRLLEVEAV